MINDIPPLPSPSLPPLPPSLHTHIYQIREHVKPGDDPVQPNHAEPRRFLLSLGVAR